MGVQSGQYREQTPLSGGKEKIFQQEQKNICSWVSSLFYFYSGTEKPYGRKHISSPSDYCGRYGHGDVSQCKSGAKEGSYVWNTKKINGF